MTLRPSREAAGDLTAVLVTFVVLAALCGVLWWALADPAFYTKTAEGVEMSEVELTRRFAVDGWYAVVAGVAGFLAGLGLTWWRSRDFWLTTSLVLVGSVLAAAVMAAVGRALGPGDPETTLAAAAAGDRVPVQLAVDAFPAYLVWPIAVLVGALMVLWSTTRPGARELAEETEAGHGDLSTTDSRDDPFRERTPR